MEVTVELELEQPQPPPPTPVQTLSKTNQIPPQYIQPPQNRPTTTATTTATLPIINLSHPSSSAEIAAACRSWGAFQVINHGIPTPILDEIRTVGSAFFNDVDVSEKMKYSCGGSGGDSEGYGSKMLVSDDGNGDVLDWRDYFDHHTFPVSRRCVDHWPVYPSRYRKVVEEYSSHMKLLAQKLLAMISESLGLRSSCIEDAVGEFYQNITICYYPPCPQPELTLGLQSHSDFGAITLLIQDDVGGLEVLKDGEWVTVQPISHAIVVILADQTEVITNREYKSAIHRAVTNANQARLSVVTFHDPAKTRIISPTPELVGKSAPRYREVLYGDFVKSWYTKGPDGKRNLDALLL